MSDSRALVSIWRLKRIAEPWLKGLAISSDTRFLNVARRVDRVTNDRANQMYS